MVKKTTVNIVVHVNDETVTESVRVPSSDQDFVALKVGPDVSVLLFNSEQAKTLANAAVAGFAILKDIEAVAEAKEFSQFLNSAVSNSDDAWVPVDPELERLLAEEEDYPDWTFTDCSEDNPCSECLADMNDSYEAYYDYENEPF